MPNSPTVAQALELLEEIKRLMELKSENPFKIRAYDKAIHNLSGKSDLLERAKQGTLTEIEGVGKGISEILTEFLLQGKSRIMEELRASLPAGLLELTQIPGVGPKKARTIIEELSIHSLAELEYACKENRLLKIPGFGPKVQQKILDGIQFQSQHRGKMRLVDAFPIAEECLRELLKELPSGTPVSETGEIRRRREVVSSLDFLVADRGGSALRKKLETLVDGIRARLGSEIPLSIRFCEACHFGFELARTTGSPEHWEALGSPSLFEASTEEEFYEKLDIPWIPPESRETGEEVALARKGALGEILSWQGIQGVFHNHTTRSDGAASLEEMVVAAKALGYRYIGISDHSQSAYYAQGLKVPDLFSQEREVREIQDKHPDIRIFWGIESDILADGSLDYEPSVLKRFDFVIASIHSRFKADKETMTQRILEAIRNPCTRFVGHLTGRLLLGRPGYELDFERVIAEAAAHDVAIELNANPARLDIDWRWGPELRARRTLISVNPDAHAVDGLKDVKYGIAMARKALMPAHQVVNTRSVKDVETWLKRA